jgi:hypothetical protein
MNRAIVRVCLVLSMVCIGTGFGAVLIQLESLSISSYSILSNGVTVGTVAFSEGANAIESVALTSSNPGAASVPSSVPLIPPNDRVTFPVRGVAPGCTTIIAAHRSQSRERRIVVHPTNIGSTFSLAVANQVVPLDGYSPGRVTTGSAAANALVSLSSSNSRVASVPSSVEAVRGNASFRISGRHEGCAIISATIRGATVSKTVQVANLTQQAALP